MNDSQEYEEYCYLSVSGLNGIEESPLSTFVSPRDIRKKRCSASFGADFSQEKLPLRRKTRNRLKKPKAQAKIMSCKRVCRSLFAEETSKCNKTSFDANGIKKVIHYREQTAVEDTQKKHLSKLKLPGFNSSDVAFQNNQSGKKREKSTKGKRVSGKQQSSKISQVMLKNVRSKLGTMCMGVESNKKLEKLNSKNVMAATLDMKAIKKNLSTRKIEKAREGENCSVGNRNRSIESKLEYSNAPKKNPLSTKTPKKFKLAANRSIKPKMIRKKSASKKRLALIKPFIKNKKKRNKNTKVLNVIDYVQKETNRISRLTALDVKSQSARNRKVFLHKKKNSLILKFNPAPNTSRSLLRLKYEDTINASSKSFDSLNQENDSIYSKIQASVSLAQAVCKGFLTRKKYKDEQFKLRETKSNYNHDTIAADIPGGSTLQSNPTRMAETLPNSNPLQLSQPLIDSTQDLDPFAETIALLLLESSKNLPTQSESQSNLLILSPNTSDRELSPSEEIVFESCDTINFSVNDLSFSLVKDSAKSAKTSIFDIYSPISIDSPTKIFKISANFISDLAEALISTMLSESLSKPLSHSIDQDLEIYISELNEVMKPYKPQHDFLKSNSTQSEFLLILSSLQDYTEYPYIPPTPIKSLLSPSLFTELNLTRKRFSFPPEVSDCQQAHDRLLFDSFNEALQSFRPQMLQSLPLSSSKRIPITKSSLSTSILKSLEILKSLNSFKAGKLEDPSLLPHEALQSHREEKLNQLIFNDILTLDHLWVSYTLEETQAVFELCDQILESLLTELLPIL